MYLAEGIPLALVSIVSVIVYKNLGIPNKQIAFYTSWLYLPWVLKPLWSPVVDVLKTRRLWIWAMQLIIGAALAGVALTLRGPHFFQYTLVLFWLVAFSSATHDIAADGFYILAMSEREQSFFSGIRNTFYRVAMILAQGGLVVLAGRLAESTGQPAFAWSITFAIAAGLLTLLGLYHWFVLPQPIRDQPGEASAIEPLLKKFFATFASFFQKPGIVRMLGFLLLYRFGEAQLVKMTQLFVLDARAHGGLELTTEQVGLMYNTVGVIALLLGGLMGGFLASQNGLKFWFWPMALAINLPDAVYVYLAYVRPDNLAIISSCVAVEQFGYGFGFTAFMLYMIYIARGEHQTAHYAICTGFMALGLMLPGMWSGWLQTKLGYPHYFIWVLLATIPSFLIVKWIPLDEEFGRKDETLPR